LERVRACTELVSGVSGERNNIMLEAIKELEEYYEF